MNIIKYINSFKENTIINICTNKISIEQEKREIQCFDLGNVNPIDHIILDRKFKKIKFEISIYDLNKSKEFFVSSQFTYNKTIYLHCPTCSIKLFNIQYLDINFEYNENIAYCEVVSEVIINEYN